MCSKAQWHSLVLIITIRVRSEIIYKFIYYLWYDSVRIGDFVTLVAQLALQY